MKNIQDIKRKLLYRVWVNSWNGTRVEMSILEDVYTQLGEIRAAGVVLAAIMVVKLNSLKLLRSLFDQHLHVTLGKIISTLKKI